MADGLAGGVFARCEVASLPSDGVESLRQEQGGEVEQLGAVFEIMLRGNLADQRLTALCQWAGGRQHFGLPQCGRDRVQQRHFFGGE